jgi:hypothetical protein
LCRLIAWKSVPVNSDPQTVYNPKTLACTLRTSRTPPNLTGPEKGSSELSLEGSNNPVRSDFLPKHMTHNNQPISAYDTQQRRVRGEQVREWRQVGGVADGRERRRVRAVTEEHLLRQVLGNELFHFSAEDYLY